MFFNWRAKAARVNVKRYEQQLDRAELKYIMQSIDAASRQGYTGIEWRGDIRRANLCTLKEYGYKVTYTPYRIYEINW
jgi:hypothetical protein